MNADKNAGEHEEPQPLARKSESQWKPIAKMPIADLAQAPRYDVRGDVFVLNRSRCGTAVGQQLARHSLVGRVASA